MSRATYWVHYRAEDGLGGYQLKTAQAGTLIDLAAQLNDLSERGWEVLEVGATSPRELDEKERQVVEALTRGRLSVDGPDDDAAP